MAILSERIENTKITVTLESSNLNLAEYDTQTKKLIVEFKKGGSYEYSDVPWDTFTKFRLAPSQGSFFSKEISKNYTFKKIE